MPLIHILPVSLRNKIAAGEVVERPASVVKELIENSLDAGSTRVEVDILRAGKQLIRVADNGAGMDREDALLCCERHATSKISDEKDLFAIKTMGFRGEALSSIAAVSRMRIVTGTAPDAGTCIEAAGGGIKEAKDCPATGTVVEIRDLFFNTPARRKFLKSDSTENLHLIDTVTREALAHYATGFSLHMDNDEVLSLPPASSHRERFLQIYGKEFIDQLCEVVRGGERLKVRAFLGNATQVRNNKSHQFVFVNDRPVKDVTIASALYRAYGDLIQRDKHPIFFVFLEVDPAMVDFNVHPTKREVRFADKSTIYRFIYETARSQLCAHAEPSVRLTGVTALEQMSPDAPAYRCTIIGEQGSGIPGTFSNPEMVSERLSAYAESVPFIYLGDTFVGIPTEWGLTIMDYHAAHERVNYERFLKKIEMPVHSLLFPHQVRLSAQEHRILLEHLDIIREFGIEVEDFGHGTLIVRTLPDVLRNADIQAVLSDVASTLTDRDSRTLPDKALLTDAQLLDSPRKRLAARLACHGSMRGREVPDRARIMELMMQLNEAEYPDRCPHGRPTRTTISLAELRKMFKK